MKFVYSDDGLSRTQVSALHKEFLEGRETAKLCNRQIFQCRHNTPSGFVA